MGSTRPSMSGLEQGTTTVTCRGLWRKVGEWPRVRILAIGNKAVSLRSLPGESHSPGV